MQFPAPQPVPRFKIFIFTLASRRSRQASPAENPFAAIYRCTERRRPPRGPKGAFTLSGQRQRIRARLRRGPGSQSDRQRKSSVLRPRVPSRPSGGNAAGHGLLLSRLLEAASRSSGDTVTGRRAIRDPGAGPGFLGTRLRPLTCPPCHGVEQQPRGPSPHVLAGGRPIKVLARGGHPGHPGSV